MTIGGPVIIRDKRVSVGVSEDIGCAAKERFILLSQTQIIDGLSMVPFVFLMRLASAISIIPKERQLIPADTCVLCKVISRRWENTRSDRHLRPRLGDIDWSCYISPIRTSGARA